MFSAARAIALGLLGLGLLAAPACKAVDYEDLPEEQVDAYCELLTRCGLFHDEGYCAEVYSTIFRLDADLDAAIDNGTVIYDDKAAKECLEGIRDAACTDIFADEAPSAACDQVLEGTIESGGACWISEQCLGGACFINDCMATCCMGTCIAEPPDAAIGQDCSGGQGCAGGYCDFQTELCTAYKAAGVACDVDTECGDLFCLGGTCQAGVAEGAPCIDGECGAYWLRCDIDSATCQRLRGEGEACNPAADLCTLGLICPEATSVCSRPTGVGSTCNDIFGFDCGTDAWCDYDLGNGEGTCQALKAPGSPCVHDDQCSTRYCDEAQVCGTEPVCVQ